METSGNPRGRSCSKSTAQAINISQELRKSSPGPRHGKHTESSSTVPRASSSSTQPATMNNEPTKRKASSIDHSPNTFKELKTSNQVSVLHLHPPQNNLWSRHLGFKQLSSLLLPHKSKEKFEVEEHKTSRQYSNTSPYSPPNSAS